jgi:cell division protein FtsN
VKNQYFVFEKKELFILIILAVLIAAVAFTVGVKWGKEIPIDDPLGASSGSSPELSDGESGQGLPKMTESQSEEEQIQKAMEISQGTSGARGESDQGNASVADRDQAKSESDATQGMKPPVMSSKEEAEKVSESGVETVSEQDLKNMEDRLNASSDENSGSEPFGGRGVGDIYTIQLGAHRSREEASKQKKFLASRGFSAQIVQVELPEKGTWYRVTVGTFGSKAKAKAFSEEVQKKIPNTSFLLQKLN